MVGDANEFIDAIRRLELCEFGEPRFSFAFFRKSFASTFRRAFYRNNGIADRSTEESSEGQFAFNHRVALLRLHSSRFSIILVSWFDADKLGRFLDSRLSFTRSLYYGSFHFFNFMPQFQPLNNNL